MLKLFDLSQKPLRFLQALVEEIRIRTTEAYRVFYVARFEEAVYVLHSFQKKTQKTAKQDIQIGQQRYQELVKFRQTQGH